MFQAVASVTAVSTTYAAKKKYSFTGLTPINSATPHRMAAMIQNFIGRSSAEESLRADAEHDEQESKRHGRRPIPRGRAFSGCRRAR